MSWKAFDLQAEEYNLWYQKNKEVLESECKLIKSFNLKGLGIEIGVGTGVFAPCSNISIGIDPAIKMLKIAKNKGIDVVRAVGETLPFKGEIFDFVIMIATLCFLERPRDVLKETWRVLKNRGSLVVCILPKDSKWGELYEKKKSEGHEIYKFAHFYTFKDAISLINDTGFKVVMSRSTLRQPPGETFKAEEPEDGFQGHGFACIKAVKDLTSE